MAHDCRLALRVGLRLGPGLPVPCRGVTAARAAAASLSGRSSHGSSESSSEPDSDVTQAGLHCDFQVSGLRPGLGMPARALAPHSPDGQTQERIVFIGEMTITSTFPTATCQCCLSEADSV